ncbi:MAG: hypothetical protein Crog4KO_18280 [Crocinitomicaceae bacterium]
MAQHAESINPTLEYLGGIQVGEVDQEVWTDGLKNAGMNTVEVTVYARQGDWDSDEIWFDETDEGALNQIRSAKKANLKVVLILRVALDHAYERNKFLWHGMIMPKSKSEIKNWFNKYREFVLKWALIGEQEGVDVIAIGSEMNALTSTRQIEELSEYQEYMLSDSAQHSMEDRALKYKNELGNKLWVQGYSSYDSIALLINDKIEANVAWAAQTYYRDSEKQIILINKQRKQLQKQWKKLIKKTRKDFSGKLTYAANFDNYFDVGFWDNLDFIGINAYFSLRGTESQYTDTSELTQVLSKGWKNVFHQVDSFQLEVGISEMPIFFTELGYTKYANSSLEPWSGFGYSIVGKGAHEKIIVWNQQPTALEERACALKALNQVVTEQSTNLQGILYWKLTTMTSHVAIEPFAIQLNSDSTDPGYWELQNFTKDRRESADK